MAVHHVPPEGLMTYASGGGTTGEDLLVACHLTLCPECRAAVASAEQLGTAMLERAAPVEVAPGSLDALLAALDAPPPPEPPPLPPCPYFPTALRRRVGPLDQVAWRSVGAGVRIAQIDADDGTQNQRVFVMDFPASFRIPVHGHQGTERLLVLRGGFRDERDHFVRGDVSWRLDGGHDVRIDDDGRCTTLFVNDGPADVGVLTSVVDWWLQR